MDRDKLKILAIDDKQDYLAALKTAVQRALPGVAVFTATSGQRGIELALAEDPDVILLDIIMPEMNGFEVCRRLKAEERLTNIPVVFITAIDIDRENRIKALDAGGEGFLPKSFEVEEMIAQIRAMAKVKATDVARSQHMESVGRLAGGVAHDFNNILTVIKCYAEILRKKLDPQDPKIEDVREILTAADRVVALTRQLLAFGRRQIMAPKMMDMNKCVEDVTNMLRRLIGEDIALTTKLAPAPCLTVIDAGQIEQALVNLVINARDAMPEGGAIELSTELLSSSGALSPAHTGPACRSMVCLKVSDSGTGMTAEVKKHLFEPFFTTKERGKGAGMGLSTVFGIVKQSGGNIEVESEPGKGTLFRICFPYCESAPGEADAGKSGTAAGEVRGGESILLVEDDESLRRLGKRILASGGYVVLTAACGPDALKELERHGKPVDILVTDVVMPGMNGRELALEIARRSMAGRILYMSGYTDDAIVKRGMLEPGLAFIYKPFTVDGLLAKVRAVLGAPADQSRA